MNHKELAGAIERLKSLGVDGTTPSIMSRRDGELVLEYINELERQVDDEFGPFDKGAWYVYKPSWTNK